MGLQKLIYDAWEEIKQLRAELERYKKERATAFVALNEANLSITGGIDLGSQVEKLLAELEKAKTANLTSRNLLGLSHGNYKQLQAELEKYREILREVKSQIEFNHKTETGFAHWTPIHNYIKQIMPVHWKKKNEKET